MTQPEHAWMVRAGDDNELADIVEQESVVAIGWRKVGDVSDAGSREEVKERYRQAFPEHSTGRVRTNAAQIYRFVQEMQVGDYVLTYIKSSREVLIGLIEGPYQYLGHPYLDKYPHMRQVDWLARVSRDDLGSRARRSLGGRSTVFNLDDYLDEIHSLVSSDN